MRHLLTLTLLALLTLLPALPVGAQAVIDLGRGGGVRPKTVDDYRQEKRESVERRARADSLAYVGCLRRAFNLLAQDSLAGARSELREALRLRPEAPGNYVVHHNLGRILMAQGQPREAADELTLALRAKPDYTQARLDRALCLRDAGSLRAALADLDLLCQTPALEKQPEHLRGVLLLRGATLLRLREPERAMQDARQAQRLAPTDLAAPILEAEALEQMGREREAMERLNQLVTSHAESTEALAARAEMEVRQGMTAAAEADLEKALQLDPHDDALQARLTQVKKLRRGK